MIAIKDKNIQPYYFFRLWSSAKSDIWTLPKTDL